MFVFNSEIPGKKGTGAYKDILSPYDSRVVGQVEIPYPGMAEDVLEAASMSFDNTMKRMPAWKRAEILYKVADKIRENHETLSQLIAAEGGKPVRDARIEVTRAANTVKMSGDEALNLNGEQITMDRSKGSENHLAFTVKQPLGVVLAISAFNHPVNLICHQAATSFAAGNSVVVKPASQTPLSCFMICGFFNEAGAEPGVINVLPISGADTEKILPDGRIRFVSFIGSAAVGWRIPKLIAPGVGYALEHGGTAVAVVDDSADLSSVVPSIIKGGYYHAGQVCVSTQNVFVKKEIFGVFVDEIIKGAAALVTGNPNNDVTDVGPIISRAEQSRILSQIEDAVGRGAALRLGGNAAQESCIEPTVLTGTNYSMDVMNSEVFGPVININPFENLNDVIEMCNRTPFSFQNAIYTSNIDSAFHFAGRIDSKAVIINDSTAFRVDWMPFGGSKESGFRVGGVRYSIEDVVEEKLIVIKTKSL